MDKTVNMDLSAKQTDWIDKLEITQLLNDYFRALDEKDFKISRMEQIFLPDAKIVRPNGTSMTGPEMIGKSHNQSFARFKSTQHLISNQYVTISGDNADIRANLIAIHLWNDRDNEANFLNSSFIAGGVITALVVHTQQGWKISSLTNRNVWKAGSGFDSMAKTDK